MCYRVFVASDATLPACEWDDSVPDFNSEPLATQIRRVARLFSLPNVMELGAHTHCACGFMRDDDETPEARALRERSREHLVAYLREVAQRGGSIEVFCCWDGGESGEIESRKTLSLPDFLAPEFPVEEQQLARIVA